MKPGKAKRMWITIPLTLGFVYVGLIVVLYFFQDRLLFFPTADIYRTPADQGWAYEEVRVSVAEETTAGWYVPAEGQRRGVVLFSHGNAGNIADRIESISVFRSLGLDVLAYDYGGYGQSTGKPSEDRCYQDIRAMWTLLVEERGIAPEEIVLFGRSLGAGSTAQLALEVDSAAVILESAFRSVPAMAKQLYPWLPVRSLARIHFDNESKVGLFKTQLLVIHSRDDSIIPYAHGRILYDLAPDPKEFLEIRGDHNEGFWASGDLYNNGLENFLERVFPDND